MAFTASTPNFDEFSVVPNFFLHCLENLPKCNGLRFERYETFLLPIHVCPHLATVCRRWLSAKNHFSFPDSKYLHFECLLVHRLRMHGWILARVSHLFRDAGRNTALFCFGILRVVGITKILRRILPRTQEVVRHQIHGSRLRHHRTFTGSRFLFSL